MKHMGCEINLIKFRAKAMEIKNKLPREQRYILFIDFKAAYDSVVHKLLFEKMKTTGVKEEIINTIKKIY